jgi:hypothetical protein
MRAAEALLRSRAAEIVAAVVRQAEAGDRAAMRLARKHGLPVEPPPEVLAARLTESIARTRATVATLLAEGGLNVSATRSAPAGAQGDRPFRRENKTSDKHPVLQCAQNGGRRRGKFRSEHMKRVGLIRENK